MECASLCMLKPQPSSMRVHSLKSVTQFKWNHLNKELRKKAPTLLASEEDALLGLLPLHQTGMLKQTTWRLGGYIVFSV